MGRESLKTGISPTGAVFLSYASEDAEAAERISTALRAAGVEVWFDREELGGGDAWDQRIRQQILDCRLFVPIISANTETRLEGYFRREWKLATDRTESMASELPFLFPVVIDSTPNTSAHVPEKFRHVQWTRLASGQVPPAFVERVRRLLSPDASFPQAATWVRRGSSLSIPASPVRRSWRSNPLSWVAGVGLVLVLGYIAVVSRHSIPPTSLSTPAAQTVPRPDTSVAFTPPPHSIAVLPFVNMSADKDQEYFSDGLTEELIDMLTKVPELRVPARTSSFYFKGKSEDIATIAQALHVAHVLEGSVRKSGNALRVTAQLIRADNGYHLWSETYDRDLKDVFKVQDDIAGAVVTALKVHLLPTQSAAQAALRTANIEAYNRYLQGRESFNRGDAEGYQRAVTKFAAATALDPHYASAYAALALAQFWLADSRDGDEAGYKSALESAGKAVALAPELGAGHAARGFLRAVYSFDFAGGKTDLDEAVALSPGDADVLHRSAVVLAILGNLTAAIAREQEAYKLDPLSAEISMRLGFFYAANQQPAEARSMYEKALAIAPNSIRGRWNLGRLDLFENRPEQALAAFRQIESKEWSLAGQAMAEYSLGHADASQRFLNQLIAIDSATDVATVYAWRGENGHALEWLERAYARRDTGLTWIKILPEYRGLRSDARYTALLQKMNLAE